MASVLQLRKKMKFEAASFKKNFIIGYYETPNGKIQRRSLNLRMTKTNKIVINKPESINQTDYLKLLQDHKLIKPMTFDEFVKLECA